MKLSSLWHGPYTVIDKLSVLNYRIQLLGVPNKTHVVHHNWLKHCFGPLQPPPEYTSQHQPSSTSTPLYLDEVRRQAPAASYTTSSLDGPPRGKNSTSTPPVMSRPHWTQRIPQRFNDFVQL